MKEGWASNVPLGTLCAIDSGSSNAQDAVDDAPYALFDRSKKIKRSTRYLFDCEALIIPGEGAEFLPRHFVGKFDLHQRAYALHSFSEKIDVKYLYYYLIYRKDYWPHVAVGATVKSLRRRHFENLPVTLAPRDEQQHIVAILDEVFAGVTTATANAEKNLNNARELFDSYLAMLFSERGKGWVRRQIGDVATTQYGLSATLNSDGEGYKIFRMGEVQDGRLVDTGRMKFININRNEFEQYRLRRGDVLFNRTNSSDLVGKTGLFDLEGDYCFASYLVRVNFDNSRMNSKFAAYLMNTSEFLARIRAKAARSVNQANINATILRNETIDFPESIETQAKVVEKFDALSVETRALEQSYENKLARLADLKQSILQKAFSGELTSPPSRVIREAAE